MGCLRADLAEAANSNTDPKVINSEEYEEVH